MRYSFSLLVFGLLFSVCSAQVTFSPYLETGAFTTSLAKQDVVGARFSLGNVWAGKYITSVSLDCFHSDKISFPNYQPTTPLYEYAQLSLAGAYLYQTTKLRMTIGASAGVGISSYGEKQSAYNGRASVNTVKAMGQDKMGILSPQVSIHYRITPIISAGLVGNYRWVFANRDQLANSAFYTQPVVGVSVQVVDLH